ncbi:MAG: ABC transporter permease [Burkholderiales bacterium]
MSRGLPLFRGRRDRELREEIEGHLAEAVRERTERGESAAEAEAAARRELGNALLVREVTRDSWGFGFLDELVQDASYALRVLRRNRGFSAVAVLTLALGIGANVAIFDVVHAVLLRPLPLPDDERLVIVGPEWRGSIGSVAPADFLDLRAQNRVFAGMTGVCAVTLNLREGEQPERRQGVVVTPEFFDVVGVRPRLGRGFLPDEHGAGRDHVVVISDSLWRARLGASPGVLGRQLLLNDEPYTVVGVAPPGFRFPEDAELWVPPRFAVPHRIGEPKDPSQNRGSHYFETYARLKPGVSYREAQADVSVIMARIAQADPTADARGGALVRNLREYLVGESRRALLVMLGAVALVLLVACANVASLLLARGAARQRELALRTALGASRGRVVRLVLTESLVLGLVGGVLGVAIAGAGVPLLVRLVPRSAQNLVRLQLDPVVLLFALAVALVTAVVFGLSPALVAVAGRGTAALHDAARSSTAGRSRRGFQRLLVTGETALALMLLAGAGLLVKSFLRMRSVDPGFQAASVVSMSVNLPLPAYLEGARRIAYARDALASIERVPGVAVAAFVTRVPLRPGSSSRGVTIDGRSYTPEQPVEKVIPNYVAVSPGYFRTLGITVLAGREFTGDDSGERPAVLIVSAAAAETFWPGESPLGRRLRFSEGMLEVVGVVADVRTASLAQRPLPLLYAPYAQDPWPFMSFVARTVPPPESVSGELLRAIQAVDKSLPVTGVRTLEQVVSESLAPRQFQTGLTSAFAALALVLAMMGVYGVMSYAVAQRTRELGIRAALGAEPGRLFREVVSEGLRVVGLGALVGLAGAFAARSALASLLFEVSPFDPATFTIVLLLLVVVAVCACLVPARRAMRVDPVVALRTE